MKMDEQKRRIIQKGQDIARHMAAEFEKRQVEYRQQNNIARTKLDLIIEDEVTPEEESQSQG